MRNLLVAALVATAGLAAGLAAVADRPLDEALEALFADIARFRAVQDDDVTMMLVRRARLADAVRSAGPARAEDPVPPSPSRLVAR